MHIERVSDGDKLIFVLHFLVLAYIIVVPQSSQDGVLVEPISLAFDFDGVDDVSTLFVGKIFVDGKLGRCAASGAKVF